jgi:hypothetical protein
VRPAHSSSGALPLGISPGELATKYPLLFHMATLGSWPSIQRHGLLSTSTLLDLFEVSDVERERIEAHQRRDSVRIEHHRWGMAVIRDQKPLDDRGLTRCLKDGLTPQDWYLTLNRHVFFWVSERRLRELLRARAYRKSRHTVLVLDTGALLERHLARVRLSPMNSGATKPMPFPRGLDTFLPPHEFPFAKWRALRKGRSPVVELAVLDGIHDVADITVAVFEMGAEMEDRLEWGEAPREWGL